MTDKKKEVHIKIETNTVKKSAPGRVELREGMGRSVPAWSMSAPEPPKPKPPKKD